MKKRSFNIAYVTAELRAKMAIERFEKEFEDAQGNNTVNQGQAGNAAVGRATNNAGGNIPANAQRNVQQSVGGY